MLQPAFGLAVSIWAGTAWGADQPAFAPPAAWVKAPEIPKASKADTTAPTRALLEDVEDHFGVDGKDTYIEVASRIQTPQGLAALGNIALTWKPDTDTLTIHKLHIVRGDQIIDVLAKGQTFTVLRRENNLEMAMLDGRLTAAMEIEGLQVGDIVDLAYTYSSRDPLLMAHPETIVTRPAIAVDRLQIREILPKTTVLRWRHTDGLAEPKVFATREKTELVIDMTDVNPVKPPKGAPRRYAEIGQLEVSGYSSWGDVSAAMTPLYQKAITLSPDSPLRKEVDLIKAGSTDPKMQAAAALRLVQDKIRYVLLAMNDGGYVPATADLTWSRRFGDCKGKTVVLIALLHELGIEAEPALISIVHGDGLDLRLPALGLFDHVIVRTVINGKVYWLDGTRSGDGDLDYLAVPNFKWALPVRASGAALEKLIVPPLEKPQIDISLHLDASAGLDVPASAHAEVIYRGDLATVIRLGLANLPTEEAQKNVRAYWTKTYNWADVKQVNFSFDEKTHEERMSVDGSITMSWNMDGVSGQRRYEIDASQLGWKSDLDREPGPHRDAPFVVAYPSFERRVTMIVLPNGGKDFRSEAEPINQTIAAVELKRSVRIDKGVVTMELSSRSIADEFPATEAASVSVAARDLMDKIAYVAAPKSYMPTDQEMQKWRTAPLTTSDDFISRGYENQRRHDYNAAVADFSQAIKLKSDSALAFADRSISYYWLGDYEKAESDAEKAIDLDPKNVIALHSRGLIHWRNRDYQKAVTDFSGAIASKPEDDFAFKWRAVSYHALKDDDRALADFQEALKIDPTLDDIYVQRAEIFVIRHEGDRALRDIDHYLTTHDGDARAHALRGSALRLLGRRDEARKELDRSFQLQPTVEAYLERAQIRPSEERDLAFGDVELALKLNPNAAIAYRVRALLYFRGNDVAAATQALNEAIRLQPDDDDARLQLAELHARTGRGDLAIQEVDLARSHRPDDPNLLNSSCWYRAVGAKDLSTALDLCSAALKIKPDAEGILDSRGLVYVRLNRFDEAIKDYDAALKLQPKLASSLFGRAIAERGKGLNDEAQADLLAAQAADPKIDARFADYGLRPQEFHD